MADSMRVGDKKIIIRKNQKRSGKVSPNKLKKRFESILEGYCDFSIIASIC